MPESHVDMLINLTNYTLCQAFVECDFLAILNYLCISEIVFIFIQKKELFHS